MKTKLDIAIYNLYSTFRKYSLDINKLRENSCSCCVTDEEIRQLTTKLLKTLTEHELEHIPF